MTTREQLALDWGDDILFADGFDDAIIGVDYNTYNVVYGINKMVEILIQEGMTSEDAREYLEYNTLCAYVGEKTPIYIHETN